jgi:patatin-like phospholipase/acyl hydrolase
MDVESLVSPAPFRVLALDGGGAKGFYTLGVLEEVEALAGSSLSARFDLIFGTSTGAIIAALLASSWRHLRISLSEISRG